MEEPLANPLSPSRRLPLCWTATGTKEFAGLLRILISEGWLDYHTVALQEERKSEKGSTVRRPVTLHLEQAGPISVVMTSARDNVEEELLTRLVLLPADESAEQTVRAARKDAARTGAKPLPRQFKRCGKTGLHSTDGWSSRVRSTP